MEIIDLKAWFVGSIPVDLRIDDLYTVVIRLLHQIPDNGIRIRKEQFFQEGIGSKLAVYFIREAKKQQEKMQSHFEVNTKI